MAKQFIRTNKAIWDKKDKSQYKDSIVFIEDAKQIWNNGVYYGTNDSQNDQNIINTTYSELKTLRDNSQLIPGMQYRITDYITTTTQKGTQSANNQFDIIVTADSENALNENARAIQSKNNESEYFGKLENDFFIKWDIETEPNTGEDTLCIYKTDVSGLNPDSEDFVVDYYGADYNDVFFYKGNYEYNGENFDVWQKCENGDYNIENNIHYYLTTPIVENGQIKPELYDTNTQLFNEPFIAEYNLTINNINYFSNSNLNAWELKYSLDNDTDRFAWADTENGKGVIYYMKDEYGNECPYDFKNIQFERTAYWFSKHQDWCNNTIGNVPNRSIFYYTFTYVDGDENIYDASIIGNTLYSDTDYIVGVYNNVIKNSSSFSIQGEQLDSLFALPDNIFYTIDDDHGVYWGCCNNTLGNNCYGNTFGNYCYTNTLGNYCQSNTLSNNCYGNSFGDFCGSNTFGNDCYNNTFGASCRSNIFGDCCYYNSFGKDCNSNKFINTCHDNSFCESCYSNTFYISCYQNSFGNNCESNTFSNYCINNEFGNSCNNNSFGEDCDSNKFSNSCSRNTFGYDCDSNKFSNNCCNNKFGDECSANQFGIGCYNNIFGSCYYYNTLGNDCKFNIISGAEARVFGDLINAVQDFVRCNTFDNGCSFNNISHQYSEYLQNYHITAGVSGQSENSMNNISFNTQYVCDLTFKTTIAKRSDGNIVIYNEADLVPWTYIS